MKVYLLSVNNQTQLFISGYLLISLSIAKVRVYFWVEKQIIDFWKIALKIQFQT